MIFGFLLSFSLCPNKTFAAENGQETQKAIISQIVLGGGNGPEEYVTIYNQTSTSLDLNGWSLEYAKNDFSASSCDLPSWSNATSGGYSQSLDGLSLPAKSNLSIPQQLNNSGSGSLRLVEHKGSSVLVHDLVGWGETPACFELTPMAIPTTKAAQRYLDCGSNEPIDTDNNFADFTSIPIPEVAQLSDVHISDCSNNEGNNNQDGEGDPSGNNNPGGGQGSGPLSSCAGVVISELLPNPAGSDSGHEFIELYNPSGKVISLAGCALQTTASSKAYEFGSDEKLESGQYKAYYDDQTGLSLENSSGGSVYLIDTDNSEINQANYAPGLDDEVSWSLIEGVWQSSFLPTPGGPNKLVSSKPCPVGQIRNIDTNRCVNTITPAAGLGACPDGKQRNSQTNRCRNIASLSSVLKACAADQERNPDTGRCRKISSSSGLTPCKTGQQRNAQTNRCRKITDASGSSAINDVKDVLSETSQIDKTSWFISAGTVFGAFLYAIWEWKNEIIQQFGVLKSRFG